jgi:shikimate kinase
MISLYRLKNLFLIGPMGAGKSTIGRLLAETLDLEFYDSDQEIEKRSGVDIAWIVDVEGEEGFREREKKVIEELTHKSGIVLSTGGGVVLSPENRKLLGAKGTVIYLITTSAEQQKRTQRSRKTLSSQDAAEIRAKLASFDQDLEPLYDEIARIRIHTDGCAVKTVVTSILEELKER